MPTIDALTPANSVNDGDELAIWQAGRTLRATRSQVLAGVQPMLGLAPGQLLGRTSAGIGQPEAINIGANLTIAHNVLSAPSPYSINTSAIGGPPAPNDRVPLAQGGQNAHVSYSQFMSGLSRLGGIDGSALTVTLGAGGHAQPLASALRLAVSVAAYGAVGDGTTDDTAAINAALLDARNFGGVVRFGPAVYIVNGQLVAENSVTLIGCAGSTIIRRLAVENSGDWIQFGGDALFVCDIFFDAGGLSIGPGAAVYIGAQNTSLYVSGCSFLGACGGSSSHGILVNSSQTKARFLNCTFSNNSGSGFYSGICPTAAFSQCSFFSNGINGIDAQNATNISICDSFFAANKCGVSVSAAPLTNQLASTLGTRLLLCDCRLENNTSFAVVVGDSTAEISNSTFTSNGSSASGGGLNCRRCSGSITGNTFNDSGSSLQASGCSGITIFNNDFRGLNGVSLLGSGSIFVHGNYFSTTRTAFSATLISSEAPYTSTYGVSFCENFINLHSPDSQGVLIDQAVSECVIRANSFWGNGGAQAFQAISALTDSISICGNLWNGKDEADAEPYSLEGFSFLSVPLCCSKICIPDSIGVLSGIVNNSQIQTIGSVPFIKVINGGQGYTFATVTVVGSGSGCAATAVIESGSIIAVTVTSSGSGYGVIGDSLSVSITGDGTGATALGYVGLPSISNAALEVYSRGQVTVRVNEGPVPIKSWTGAHTQIAKSGAGIFRVVDGVWHDAISIPVEYLAPDGDGGFCIRSQSLEDVALLPGAGGNIRLGSATEPIGAFSCVGRGAPGGRISAPPGSDYRNLDGGAGNTFWIKQIGTDSQGWHAVC